MLQDGTGTIKNNFLSISLAETSVGPNKFWSENSPHLIQP